MELTKALRMKCRFFAQGSNAVPCNFHLYDSIMEGVQVSTLTMTTEPSRWSDTMEQDIR